MTQTPQQPPAGWYPDPAGGSGERFWDGQAWSQSTRDAKPAFQPHQQVQAGPTGGYAEQPRPSYAQDPYAPRRDVAPGHGAGPQPYAGYGPQVPVQGGYRLAGFWWRALGYIIDSIVIGFISYFLTAEMQAQTSDQLAAYFTRLLESSVDPTIPAPQLPGTLIVDMTIVAVVSMLLLAAYRTITVGLLNATLGQKLLGLRVARLGDESLAPVGWGPATVRGVAGGVLYQVIGFFAQISVLFTDRKQTIPDLVSKTVVVNTREAVR
ncbi:RDD family protein [Tessaracoccus oleiagri]|uniref:RDD family protein n=1 Tax=Tessaracoccus oleiagri TaxID=686624 RepID=A0A1G9JHK2_9ACTN|nr:RDD family protein [Tessaracoccus oleiagri]SDL37060.1 Protein of unknown function [Tessaracoccus oleiagri]